MVQNREENNYNWITKENSDKRADKEERKDQKQEAVWLKIVHEYELCIQYVALHC